MGCGDVHAGLLVRRCGVGRVVRLPVVQGAEGLLGCGEGLPKRCVLNERHLCCVLQVGGRRLFWWDDWTSF